METKKKTRAQKNGVSKGNPSQQTLRDMFGHKPRPWSSDSSCDLDVVEILEDAEDAVASASAEVGRKVIQVSSSSLTGSSQPTRMFPMFEKRDSDTTTQIISPSHPMHPMTPEVIEIPDEDTTTLHSHAIQLPDTRQSPPPVPVTGSRDDPIVIESPPRKSTILPVLPQPGTVWSIFERNPGTQPSKLKERYKAIQGIPVPFPDQVTQHIRGPQSTLPPTLSQFALRSPRAAALAEDAPPHYSLDTDPRKDSDPGALITRSFSPVLASGPETHINAIPRAHRRYPAVAGLVQRAKTLARNCVGRGLWTEQMRPKRADEVIGNEERALYLRDWLVALQLQNDQNSTSGEQKSKKRRSQKKPTVIRHIKKKRRLGLDDFIASDDDDQGDCDPPPDLDDFEFCKEMQERLGHSSATTPDASQYSSALSDLSENEDDTDVDLPFDYVPPNFATRIHNTILLVGPSGCGKTAAVYACAEELGWEVFEVHPGIGERSGSELLRLVGDVGKNHIVHTASPRLLQAPRAHGATVDLRGSKRIVASDEELNNAMLSDSEADAPRGAGTQHVVKQSLVLIEEADVLYRSDTGFWPAVVSIIKDCRRPVVLTCNDITLVPTADLPLQSTLHFEPCPSPLAVSYLQAASLSEGIAADRKLLAQFYDGGQEGPSELFRWKTVPDLRFAINQLQFWSAGPAAGTFDTPSPQNSPQQPSPVADPPAVPMASLSRTSSHHSHKWEIFRRLNAFYDSASYVEAELSFHSSRMFKLTDSDSKLHDGQLGYTVLPAECSTHPPLVSPFYGCSAAIPEEALSAANDVFLAARAEYPCLCEEGDRDSAMEDRRAAYTAQLSQVVASCLGPVSQLDGNSAVHMDYIPWIRYMVEVDNAREGLTSIPSGTQQGRQTRNSKRALQERHIDLDGAELSALAQTRFGDEMGG